MISRPKKLLLIAILIILAAGLLLRRPVKAYEYKSTVLPGNFSEFIEKRKPEDVPVRPGCEEKIINPSADHIILYIHGFSACPVEGEYVINQVAEKMGYGVFYLRLPGHGTNLEDFQQTSFDDYLNSANDVMNMLIKQNKKITLIGSSMGGLISVYLAYHYNDFIENTILISPFFDFAKSNALALKTRFGGKLGTFLTAGKAHAPDYSNKDIFLEGYEDFWYTSYPYSSVDSLVDLKNFVLHDVHPSGIHKPVSILYYEKDRAAKISRTLTFFSELKSDNQEKPNQLFRVEKGQHVLTSKYVFVDYDFVYQSILQFLQPE